MERVQVSLKKEPAMRFATISTPFFYWLLATGYWLLVLVSSAAAAFGPAPPALPPGGRLVDVDGHRLHLVCTGQGSPTVVLHAGAGAFSFDWGLVQPEVAKFTRVCKIGRASCRKECRSRWSTYH